MHIEQPSFFKSREYFSKSPKLYDKLKIIAYDDLSFSYYGGPRLPSDDLFTLIKNLEKRNPKAILIDSLLSDNTDKTENPTYTSNTTFSGAFLNAQKIPYRKEISEKKLKTVTKRSNSTRRKWINMSRKNWFVYAHSDYYNSLIKDIGHLTYNEDGTIAPYFFVNDDKSIPHISLYAADKLEYTESRLMIDGNQVPLDKNGNIQINYRPISEFYKQAKSLKFPMERARSGIEEKFISPGDTILILLNFYTGNTDFHETAPFGQIPGALLIATVISDIKSNTWIHRIDHSWFFIIVFGLLGCVIGIASKSFMFLISFLSIITISLSAIFYLFMYQSVMIPWFLPTFTFVSISLTYYIHARLRDEIKFIETEEYLRKILKKLKGKVITPFSTDQFNLLRSSVYTASQHIHQPPNKKYFYKLKTTSLKNTNYEVFSIKASKMDYFVVYQCDSKDLPELINFCILTELNSGIESNQSVSAILARIHNIAKTFKDYPIKLILIEISDHTLKTYSWGEWKSILVHQSYSAEILKSKLINETNEAMVNTSPREMMKGLIVAFDPLENVEIDLSSGYKADKILGDNSGSFFLISL